MTETINLILCLLTIAFGLFGFLAPRYTAAALDLQTTNSTMGLSEIRASVGGLFVVAGLAAILTDTPEAYFMLGWAYAGAALGRAVSLVRDKPPFTKVLIFGGIEAVFAALLLLLNL